MPDSVEKPQTLDYASPRLDESRNRKARVRSVIRITIATGVLLLIFLLAIFPAVVSPPRVGPGFICQSNINVIHNALLNYASDHDGRFPNTLADLVAVPRPYVPLEQFVCPASDDTPVSFDEAYSNGADLFTGGHLSYVYVGGGLSGNSPGDIVVLFEFPLHRHDRVNVLLANGEIECLTPSEARVVIDQFAAGIRPIRFPTTQPTTQPATR